MPDLIPLALQDAPALIESVFPAQKISFEAQRERKAGSGQTLTALGSYWKGRKPLILVRAIVLGSLLPQTDNAEKDLEIFEQLMAFDSEGLARRAIIQNKLKPKDIAALITLHNPWDYFSHHIKKNDPLLEELQTRIFPLDCDEAGIRILWRRDIDEKDKIRIVRQALDTFPSYGAKATLCKRPEELNQEWLYEAVWDAVNKHYAHLGVRAHSHQELIEQLGILRYGHRPRVGDTFCGGGSIPFEAARLGCDVYASDLNPVACMLTWGALNIVGASPERRAEIKQSQRDVAEAVDKEIIALGIEHDAQGNRAKAYLYCLEARCPETGWMVPISPSWIISKSSNTIARLIPDYDRKRFDIQIITNVSDLEMNNAENGTLKNNNLTYNLNDKMYTTPIKTIRGDYRDTDGKRCNQLRLWRLEDITPDENDIYQERLYCIQWVDMSSLNKSRKLVYFAAPTEVDLEQEKYIETLVKENISEWQLQGIISDMEIESGKENEGPIRTNGWSYWHHMFTPRQILIHSIYANFGKNYPECKLIAAKMLDYCNKSSQWRPRGDYPEQLFSGQSMKTMFTWGVRSCLSLKETMLARFSSHELYSNFTISNDETNNIHEIQDIFITDPPYADAVHYHEITEFFIAWLRKNPPAPFDEWSWDSRRALAIKGSGADFRKGMVDAYRAMTEHMPDNGMQCVMFTHQDTNVWSDMVGIFWAAGLQVAGAWYIATETTSELKKGGYVQGTVILMLRKRPAGERSGFKQRILPAVRNEVKAQIEQMMHLNDEVEGKMGEPVFNDSDLQMAGYAAALKVLTAYTRIGGEDVTTFALRPRQRGEVTVVDEIVQQAAEAANSLLVPDGLSADTWQRISGIQRFYLRMMDMETSGASKLDNYQNFAKAFRVEDYTKVMGNMMANKAHLKGVQAFDSRDLTDSTELGASWLGRVMIGLQQLLADVEPQVVVSQLQAELPDFMEVRPLLIDLLHFVQHKSPDEPVRGVAEVLANRLSNLRALGQ